MFLLVTGRIHSSHDSSSHHMIHTFIIWCIQSSSLYIPVSDCFVVFCWKFCNFLRGMSYDIFKIFVICLLHSTKYKMSQLVNMEFDFFCKFPWKTLFLQYFLVESKILLYQSGTIICTFSVIMKPKWLCRASAEGFCI